jgi:hypothetical protein
MNFKIIFSFVRFVILTLSETLKLSLNKLNLIIPFLSDMNTKLMGRTQPIHKKPDRN